MTIEIPNNIKSEYNGYNFFISLINKHINLKNQTIYFDFENVTFIEANLCSLLGAIFEILETNGNTIKIINIKNTGVENVLRKNEFLLPFGYNKIHDDYYTSLTYKKFTPNDDVSFYKYIQSELLDKADFPTLSKKLGKEILRNIFEIYENARTHGQCDFIHTCGQFFPKQEEKPLHFTIVDKGINIKENVSRYLNKEIEAEDAIEWAMIKGNTTKTGSTSGGLGLAVIFEFIKLNSGKIQVISCDGFYEFKNGQIIKNKLDCVFDGTIVNIKFNLNDPNHYMLSGEQEESFENIF